MEAEVRWVGCEIVTSLSSFSLLLFTNSNGEEQCSRDRFMVLTGQVSRFFRKRSNRVREIKMKRREKGKAIGTSPGRCIRQKILMTQKCMSWR